MTTMAHTTIATNILQALDIAQYLTAQIALSRQLADFFAQLLHIIFGQFTSPGIRVNAYRRQNLAAGGTTNTENIGQADFDTFIAGQITPEIRAMCLFLYVLVAT
jgi:hypothetical protein